MRHFNIYQLLVNSSILHRGILLEKRLLNKFLMLGLFKKYSIDLKLCWIYFLYLRNQNLLSFITY